MMHARLNRSAAIAFLLLAGIWAHADDWPTWRHDAARTAVSQESLVGDLQPQWTRKLQPIEPAWPDQPRLQFDTAYEPVVAGNTLYVASPRVGSVIALDSHTGEERWRFYSDGPIRFAPTVWNNKLYFSSDDGWLYCLNAADGTTRWKFRGGPDDRKLLGNKYMISAWPARGAPVISNGKVYFAAGIWPFMGVFLHALDAETGQVVWSNDGAGIAYTMQPHNSFAFAGIAPQGYLAVMGEQLFIPNGRAVPARFNRSTGKLEDYRLADGWKIGGYSIAGSDRYFFNGGSLFSIETGEGTWLPSWKLSNLSFETEDRMSEPVIEKDVMYASMDRLGAYKIEMSGALNNDNKPVRKPKVEEIWGLDIKARIHLKAGERLFASKGDSVMAVEIPWDKTVPKISWKARVNGTVESVIAADGRLFVSTREGSIHCFGSGGGSARSMSDSIEVSKTEDDWTAAARDILKESGVTEGYCMALGLGSGRLVNEIVRQSNLHVIVFEGDARKVNDKRRELDANGLYGARIEIISIDPAKATPSQYFASLIVSEDPKSGGVDHFKSFVEKAFRSLRPYGGVLALQLPDAFHADFAAAVQQAGLEKASVSRKGSLSLLRRDGALPGAGAWTHQYADPSNTIVSKDSRVRLPLGVLWFGGSMHDNVLPRHGHGPSPQVVGGRLFIEGPEGISARDVYTGRLLWEVKLPGFGASYNNTSHQPGANSIGSNFVTVEDGVYVVLKDRWLRLDPATGKTISEFIPPAGIQAGEKPELGFLAISGDLMITGVSPQSFEFDPVFRPFEFALYPPDNAKDKDNDKTIKNVLDILAKWAGGPIFPRKPSEKDVEFIVRNLDAAINEPSLIKRVPKSVVEANATVQAVQAKIDAYVKTRPADTVYDTGLRSLNRLLLKELYPILPYRERGGAGNSNSDYVSSKRLVILNRFTGKVLWQREAVHGFRHNAICVGDGKIFCIDRLPDPVLKILMLGKKVPTEGALLCALDARTGAMVWKMEKDVFGTWLGYSEKHDILLQSGRPSSDMLMNEPDNRMIALRGKDGTLLWDKPVTYRSSCMLHGDWIITDGNATSMLTGDAVNWANPLTGMEQPWAYHRMYGCNSPIGSTNLITFRSAAAGFYDIERLGGVGNLGGFKSSCTPNLIPADGVLNAPDYTRTCLCSYQNQASLALVHMPDAEMWTSTSVEVASTNSKQTPDAVETNRIKRIGINLGAPGDRRDDTGTLWFEYPVVGAESPKIPILTAPDGIEWYYRHSSRIEGEGLKWVAASGAKGISDLSIELLAHAKETKPYIVRLYFAEPEFLTPGQRIFDVSLQGDRVLNGFDISKEAGGPNRIIVREFKGIKVKDILAVHLLPSSGSKNRQTILCGVEIIADGW